MEPERDDRLYLVDPYFFSLRDPSVMIISGLIFFSDIEERRPTSEGRRVRTAYPPVAPVGGVEGAVDMGEEPASWETRGGGFGLVLLRLSQ